MTPIHLSLNITKYLLNSVSSNVAPVGNHTYRIEWPHDQWRHEG